MMNYKPYVYKKGTDAALDEEFAAAKSYGKVKPGESEIFWKFGLNWYHISLDKVQRIFRRMEPLYARGCGGVRGFTIEWLVLILQDGSELVLHIGEDVKTKAEALLQALKDSHPELQYGKV